MRQGCETVQIGPHDCATVDLTLVVLEVATVEVHNEVEIRMLEGQDVTRYGLDPIRRWGWVCGWISGFRGRRGG